jgi:membrane protease YdiL (CAAX protease family)
MNTNSFSTSLVIGAAAFALVLVVAGVLRLRRNQAGGATGSREDEREVEVGTSGEEHTLGKNLPDERESSRNVNSNASQESLPLKFFLLLFVITIPFWIFGGNRLPIPIKLPVSALAAFNPLIAASILSYQGSGFSGVKELFKKVFDYKKIKNKIWYVPILLLNPLISILAYAIMRFRGLPLPDPIQFPVLIVPVYFVVFFIFAIGEELGWTGYAIDPMQNRWGALKASTLLGLVWAIYHLIPDLQNQQAVDWILWHRLGTVLLRILMVWLYNNTGKSVFSAILFHAMDNLSWALFPNYGSHYDPFVIGILLCITAVIVILGWGPKTLARYRHAGVSPV